MQSITAANIIADALYATASRRTIIECSGLPKANNPQGPFAKGVRVAIHVNTILGIVEDEVEWMPAKAANQEGVTVQAIPRSSKVKCTCINTLTGQCFVQDSYDDVLAAWQLALK